jgi:hypothetical protein
MSVNKNKSKTLRNKATKENFLKRFYHSQIGASILGSLVVSFVVLLIGFAIGLLDIRKDFLHIRSNVDTLSNRSDITNKKLKEFTDNYINIEGQEIKVGVNSELNRNTVSVYKGNKANLKFCDGIIITNTVHDLKPSVKLVVGIEKEFNDNNDQSEADIFISKEAAETLWFKNYKKVGVSTMTLKKLPKE